MLVLNGQSEQTRRDIVEVKGSALLVEQGGEARRYEFHPYRKTALTYAARMDEPFVVDTKEGTMRGAAGDWLAVGPEGELYPIAASVFERSYAALHEDNDE